MSSLGYKADDVTDVQVDSYVRCLFRLVLTPLFHHGIGLEVHGQNTVIRICRESRQIKGFAVRDFGGIRLHTPTFKKKGISLATMLPGASILTDEWKNVWTKVHHAMIQNHVGDFVVSLGLENYGGWATIRSILSLTIEKEFGGAAKGMHDYLVSQTMPFKCFLRMRIEGKDVRFSIPSPPIFVILTQTIISTWKGLSQTFCCRMPTTVVSNKLTLPRW